MLILCHCMQGKMSSKGHYLVGKATLLKVTKHQNLSCLCNLNPDHLVCRRGGAAFNYMIARCCSTRSVSFGAQSEQGSYAEGGGCCFVASSPCNTEPGYCSLSCASCCTIPRKSCCSFPPPESVPTAVGPGGEPHGI